MLQLLPGPDGVVVVAVCDELMRRTHLLVQQSADVMFVDATGSLDRCNHQADIYLILRCGKIFSQIG